MITYQLQNLEQELTLQTHSCLEVHNKASNMISTAELGKNPMIIDINNKILSSLYKSGQNSSYSNLMKQFT